MTRTNDISKAVRRALFMGALATAGVNFPAHAQEAPQDQPQNSETVTVTGTRITVPGTVSSSPIYSIGVEEIQFQQQPEVEKILRLLPITAPTDGQNANNGTDGAATVNLRGLGPQRNLILINGKRLTPYNFDGLIDTSTIPTALIDRIDIVTGGASAVYGSDAISGALNFILKEDFEGIELNGDYSRTAENDGDIRNATATLGKNFFDGRANVTANFNWAKRDGVQLGSRPLGQLGIATADGAGYDQFLQGQGPVAAPDGCGGPNSVVAGGSTTTLPTRVGIAGGPGIGQFRDDGSIGSNCSVFNFNPYNYYQTPQDRYGGTILARFEINDHAEPYARMAYSSTEVTQQIAASGVFGTPFWTPLANDFIGAQARAAMISAAEAGRTAGTVAVSGIELPNWRDINGNGVVDQADDLLISYRRRTVEFGERSTGYDSEAWQAVVGTRGQVVNDWNYDVSLQYGESDRTELSLGYTNVTNIANAVDAVGGVCRGGDPNCVPINLFGGFGSITDEMAAYSGANAVETQHYEQTIYSASINGPLNSVQLPWSDDPAAVSFGLEYREETATSAPDACLQLAPASCLGGAGGYTLAVNGSYDVKEAFTEAILPLVNDRPGIMSLNLELGYRYSDYNISGGDDTYKYGLNWQPMDQLRVRLMRQLANRAPNIGELFDPQVTNLDNASFDPCSVANAGNIDATLRARCIATGMSAAQVGTVEDIVSGQVNVFTGTDLNAQPGPEQADTLTLGLVWTPRIDGIRNATVSLDYYDIDIDNVINEYSAQQVLDTCYQLGDTSQCSKIQRIGGTLTLPGSGVQTFTTNLIYLRAEGVELGFNFGFDVGPGTLQLSGNLNHYLTHESQTDLQLPVLDCLGRYGTACGSAPGEQSPLPKTRFIQRTSYSLNNFEVSALWRHLGSVSIEESQRDDTFDSFERISAYNYLDLYGSWSPMENVKISAGVSNLFDKSPPVVGNEAADTRSNSGNTFPSHYDTLGRIYSLGARMTF